MKNNIDFRKGYDLCMQHISQLTQDADLLAEIGSFGHAIFLYFTAMEEATKAFYYAGVHANLFQHEEVRRDLMDHLFKTGFFSINLLGQAISEKKNVSAKLPTRDEFIQGLKDFYESVLEARSIREASLYIDLEDKEWSTPLDFDEEDFTTMKGYITKFVAYVERVAETFFEIPKEMQKEVPIVASTMLISVGIVITEGLYRNKILTREEYDRIKSEIERRIEELKNKTN